MDNNNPVGSCNILELFFLFVWFFFVVVLFVFVFLLKMVSGLLGRGNIVLQLLQLLSLYNVYF